MIRASQTSRSSYSTPKNAGDPDATSCNRAARAGRARRGRQLIAALAVSISGIVLPFPAHAQLDARAELATAGANIAIGAASAAISALVQGQDVSCAVLGGAFGGALSYAGKRLSAGRFDGAGLAGRTVHGIGASVVRNAGRGAGVVDRLTVPIGPVSAYWRADDGLRFRVDVPQLAYTAYLAYQPAYTLDWSATLSGGSPVFARTSGLVGGRLPNGAAVGAYETVGVVRVSDRDMVVDYGQLLAHERVHVLQRDFFDIAIGRPLEHWALRHVPGGGYVDIGVVSELVGMGLLWAAEAEAYGMAGQR